jgi:nucleotide-binding universal stress UspA family protein
MFEKIIVPLDGSSFAEESLPYAEELACRMGSRIVLLNILEPITTRYENLLESYLLNQADKLKQRILENSGQNISIETLLVKGDAEPDLIGAGLMGLTIGHPASDIITAAISQKASLIVMATHGYSGFQQFTMSSVTDTVVHHSSMPVLLVRPSHQCQQKGSICRRIVVPLDGSELAEHAVTTVEQMAAKMVGQKMEATILHVVHEGHKATHPLPSATFLSHVAHPAWLTTGIAGETYVNKVYDYLETMGRKLISSGINITCIVCPGKPETEIARVVNEIDAGMVVMSSHSRNGLSRLFIGSVAERLLRIVDASILLLRPGRPYTENGE